MGFIHATNILIVPSFNIFSFNVYMSSTIACMFICMCETHLPWLWCPFHDILCDNSFTKPFPKAMAFSNLH
jgi:hypothetical protein